MKKYRKKPVEVEAIQWDGNPETFFKIANDLCERKIWHDPDDSTLVIETLEGEHIAKKGDFIIKGVKGECYPCKPDIFKMTYEEV